MKLLRLNALPSNTQLEKTAVTIGNFDGVHLGHRAVIDLARAHGPQDAPLGIVTFTPHPREFFAPTRVISPSCNTRSRLTWASKDMSPISSRKMVPPSASSNLPAEPPRADLLTQHKDRERHYPKRARERKRVRFGEWHFLIRPERQHHAVFGRRMPAGLGDGSTASEVLRSDQGAGGSTVDMCRG